VSESCGWCADPAVTEVIFVKGTKNRRTAPVCEDHAQDFEQRGLLTLRLEQEREALKYIRNTEQLEELRRTMGE
jgi:hypothetical protein